MRIVQYLSRFRSRDGGVPRAVLDLSALLSGRGHEVVVLCGGAELVPESWPRGSSDGFHGNAAPDAPADRTPRVVELSPWNALGRSTSADRSAIEDAVRWGDVVHLHVPWDRRHRIFAAAARRAGRRYLLTPHGMLDRWTLGHRPLRKRCFLALGGRRVLEEAAVIQCNSVSEAEQSRDCASRAQFAVAPLAVDLASCHSIPDLPDAAAEAPPRLLALGRLDPIKGLEVVIAALRLLQSRGVTATLEVAGEGPPEYVADLRAAAGESLPLVRFHGHVSGERKRALLGSVDLLVHPSFHENFGVALVEAMAAGRPVVTTTGVNIAPELVESGGAVAVVPGEPHAFAAAIEAMLADRAELRRRGAAAREWTRRVLAPEAIGATYEALYRGVIDGPARRPDRQSA